MIFHIHKSCEMFNQKTNFVMIGGIELLYTTMIENVKKKRRPEFTIIIESGT